MPRVAVHGAVAVHAAALGQAAAGARLPATMQASSDWPTELHAVPSSANTDIAPVPATIYARPAISPASAPACSGRSGTLQAPAAPSSTAKRCTNRHSRQACPTLNPPASSPVTAPRKRRRACAIMLLAMLPAPSSDGPCAPAGRCGSECTDPASLVGSAKDPPPSLEPSLPAWLHASLACSPMTQSALSAAAMHAAA